MAKVQTVTGQSLDILIIVISLFYRLVISFTTARSIGFSCKRLAQFRFKVLQISTPRKLEVALKFYVRLHCVPIMLYIVTNEIAL